jgi:hypothetical protein
MSEKLTAEQINQLCEMLGRVDGDVWEARGVWPEDGTSLRYLVTYEDGEVLLHLPEHAEFVAALRNAAPALLAAAEENAGLRAEVNMRDAVLAEADSQRDTLRARLEKAEDLLRNLVSAIDDAEPIREQIDEGEYGATIGIELTASAVEVDEARGYFAESAPAPVPCGICQHAPCVWWQQTDAPQPPSNGTGKAGA